jgi:hypothetical protein
MNIIKFIESFTDENLTKSHWKQKKALDNLKWEKKFGLTQFGLSALASINHMQLIMHNPSTPVGVTCTNIRIS